MFVTELSVGLVGWSEAAQVPEVVKCFSKLGLQTAGALFCAREWLLALGGFAKSKVWFPHAFTREELWRFVQCSDGFEQRFRVFFVGFDWIRLVWISFI